MDNNDTITISDNDINITFSDYGAAQPTYTFASSDIGTITLDSNMYQNYTISPATNDYMWTTTNNNVHIAGDGITMQPGADIKIGDKSLVDAIEKIEERLAILKPNEELEGRWEQLKELRKQYTELEKEILEKEKIMNILKEE